MKRRLRPRSGGRRLFKRNTARRMRARSVEKAKLEKQRRNLQVFRSSTVFVTVFVAMSALVFRLGYIQITKGSAFRASQNVTTVQRIPIIPARGRIYDSTGQLLAYDQPSYSVYFTRIQKINTTNSEIQSMATLLAPQFHQTTAQVVQLLKSQQQYSTITLFKNVTEAQLTFVTEHQGNLPGLSVQLDSQRTYPYGDLLGQVLGYVGPITPQNVTYYLNHGYMENQQVGVAGLELQYENLLRGKNGYQEEQYSLTSAAATHVGTVPPVAGNNLQLTINGRVQAVTQQLMMTTIQNYDRQNNIKIPTAAAVMMNVHTGAILAMVSYPYMDPNWFVPGNNFTAHAQYLSTSGAEQNSAIQMALPPGSTAKPSNLITALDYGIVTPNTTFNDNAPYQMIGTYLMHEDANYGIVNDVTALAVSDDRFFYNVGLNFGKWLGSTTTNGGYPMGGHLQKWRDTYFIRGLTDIAAGELRFGLGRITGIDLPGEVAGAFYIEDQQQNSSKTVLLTQQDIVNIRAQLKKTGSYTNYGSPYDLAAMAFGQGQQFTPIELAQYVSTIANGGKRLTPHLLEAIYPPGLHQTLAGQTPVKVIPTQVQANLHLNPTYLNLDHQGMYQAAHYPLGTVYGGFVGAHYAVAGKTGTAGIYLPGIGKTNNSVFIGFAPYNNPQIAVAIMVPGAGYGATTAVPLGRQMMDAYFNSVHASFMPKSGWTNQNVPSNWTTMPAYTQVEQAK
ncbi:peptidoglycan D,D-transpeptidase FtsI family protein [Alicyclobacillus sp. ALC3]|uniref:peptidoglycan D,D-transpeptidase FtsI family protein n=1 Tax=Alicyclobacillus sp. ALC3 TaxID=2796143 RepID=UPI002378F067|nr:penicillin-binding transpeptidase domain-containing protein [Alicyclobacillus sp. ALC3]WDL95393.1 peptidoglycan glycosyltransferase [Alicyclobacillus sp. ALC3]